MRGRVIGIPTLAATDPEFGGAQAPGIGFAIPSNTVKDVAGRLIASGGSARQAGRADLGVVVATSVGGGLVVESVQPGGPADRVGIQPGDVIVSVAGQETPTADVLSSVLATLPPGQTVDVGVVDVTGAQRAVSVKLGSQPGG